MVLRGLVNLFDLSPAAFFTAFPTSDSEQHQGANGQHKRDGENPGLLKLAAEPAGLVHFLKLSSHEPLHQGGRSHAAASPGRWRIDLDRSVLFEGLCRTQSDFF